MRKKTDAIVGLSSAEHTAALRLCRRSPIQPIDLHASGCIGRTFCTHVYTSSCTHIGSHRFFSKSDWIRACWTKLMQTADCLPGMYVSIGYHQRNCVVYPCISGFNSAVDDESGRAMPEKMFKDLLLHRFGSELYRSFFKSYAERVWSVSCEQIPAASGVHRIKNQPLRKAFTHFFKKLLPTGPRGMDNLKEKPSETSLIEQFLSHKYGTGQFWNYAAQQVEELGRETRLCWRIDASIRETDLDGIQPVVSVEASTKCEQIDAEGELTL